MAVRHTKQTGRPIYSIDEQCGDAGAFYVFKIDDYYKYGTIGLYNFPWGTTVLTDNQCQDINTPDDLEKAKIKAGI